MTGAWVLLCAGCLDRIRRDRDHEGDRFLVDAGIEPGRLTTRGAGPDEPIAENRTAKGKAHNRRIEFKLID